MARGWSRPPIAGSAPKAIIEGMAGCFLVVDDSIVARMSIKGIIKDRSPELREASSGEEAVEIIRGGYAPDLIFLDLTMPGMGGLAALRAIRALRPEQKVIVVTADMQARTIADATEAGAWEVIRKPADRELVLGLLGRAGV